MGKDNDYNQWESDAYYYKDISTMPEKEYEGENDKNFQKETEPDYDDSYLKKTKYFFLCIAGFLIIISLGTGGYTLTRRVSPILAILYFIEGNRDVRSGKAKEALTHYICSILALITFFLTLVILSRKY